MARILVVDDERLFRDTLCLALSRMGHDPVPACDGNEAIDIFKRDRFDAVITDILLPEKDGIEIIMEIKACDSRVLIIAISGGGKVREYGFLGIASKFGADITMQKPFSLEQLRASLTGASDSPSFDKPLHTASALDEGAPEK